MNKMIDLTLNLTEAFNKFGRTETLNAITLGHIGTHIDIMDSGGLNIERFISMAHLIDVSNIFDREITLADTNLEQLEIVSGDSILFRTDWMNQTYQTDYYFKNHPFLSYEVIDFLVERKVNLIGLDAPGVRRGAEHMQADIYCAEQNVFILENLTNLNLINKDSAFMLYCFPLKLEDNSGVTCRAVAAQQ